MSHYAVWHGNQSMPREYQTGLAWNKSTVSGKFLDKMYVLIEDEQNPLFFYFLSFYGSIKWFQLIDEHSLVVSW